MGLLGKGFAFLLGTSFGIYVAQNYHVPEARRFVCMARRYEELHRKKNSHMEDSSPDGPFAAPKRENTVAEFRIPHRSHEEFYCPHSASPVLPNRPAET
ncbi:hypothetical protein HPP92_009943 [Vanilla planifolia]|uniref:Uncharacterized protein n=1 Tax=Vanilla planifolia TaxID=51239 RepID=A0A835R479_VANPL|nr:hypothetical protein HPP92_009943 [Vanilla planifolia]